MAICGLGNVGERLADFIIERFQLRKGGGIADRKLYVWDLQKKILDEFPKGTGVIRTESLTEVFERAEVIFGCTGSDLTSGIVGKLDSISDKQNSLLDQLFVV